MSKFKGDAKIRAMCDSALLIALGTLLAQIKLFRMPSGGSVTLCSMLPFIIVAFRHGTFWGLIAGIANSLLQMALGGVYAPPAGTFIAFAGSVLLDYVLAYVCLGLSAEFSKPFEKKSKTLGVVMGTLICCLLRFICAFLSGFLIWGSIADDGISAVIYSLTYNGGYMLPETLITVAVTAVLAAKLPLIFRKQ